MSGALRVGIDLGGTKIEIVALDDRDRERLRRRIPTPRGDYAATIAAIATLVAQAERELGARASVGIGIPGTISPLGGRVKNANSTWLNGRPLAEDLRAALGREARIENDANCLALSEASDGAAAGARTVFAAILGTGVGGGIVADGRLLRGANAIAGEWGHNPLPSAAQVAGRDHETGPRCWCGRSGCIETWLSGPGFEADHERVSGQRLAAGAIVAAAGSGDVAAAASLERYVDRLARALASVINLLDPHAIVLGGGLSNVDALYEQVPRRWGRYVFSDAVATPLLRSAHGDSSGVRGAARLWP